MNNINKTYLGKRFIMRHVEDQYVSGLRNLVETTAFNKISAVGNSKL